MKESAFRTSVLKHVPKGVHNQPLPASFMGVAGTPDHYFDLNSDLWCEWKVMRRDDHLPVRIPKDSLPTPEQVRWLTRRWLAGGNAIVIVGIKLRARCYGVVLTDPTEWEAPLHRSQYEPRLASSAELGAYIVKRVTHAPSDPSDPSWRPAGAEHHHRP